jgi:hypothetical protein
VFVRVGCGLFGVSGVGIVLGLLYRVKMTCSS